MKGLKGVDPTNEPNDLVVLVACIGWVFFLIGAISIALDWLCNLTWFTF